MFDKHYPIAVELDSMFQTIEKYKLFEYSSYYGSTIEHPTPLTNMPFELLRSKRSTVMAKLYKSKVDGVPSFLIIPHTDDKYHSISMVVIPVKEEIIAGIKWDFMTKSYSDHDTVGDQVRNAFFVADKENITVWTNIKRIDGGLAATNNPDDLYKCLDGNDLRNIVNCLYLLAVTHQCSLYREERRGDDVYQSRVYPEFDDDKSTVKEVFEHELLVAFGSVVFYDNDTIDDLELTIAALENGEGELMREAFAKIHESETVSSEEQETTKVIH